jgi:general secretion pathway protein G
MNKSNPFHHPSLSGAPEAEGAHSFFKGQRPPPARRTAGFTILEMLVVLVIIGLVVGLVGPRVFTNVGKSRVQAAQAQIKLLRGAVENFQLDVGRYPTTQEGLAVLNTKPAQAALSARWRGPYLQEDLPSDPWGNAYLYSIPGANGQPFALYSLGQDGKFGGEDQSADIGILPAPVTTAPNP